MYEGMDVGVYEGVDAGAGEFGVGRGDHQGVPVLAGQDDLVAGGEGAAGLA
ncbi:hypothetical protein [Actinomadura rubrisoli]|uniref:hypothetical protein n=1 Tax=Actinomadura rubrisoli TaxID=2530368 RepID=UPI0014053F16|nr:hypothetical protein [Actinomadura rubrisoli]